MLDLGAVEAARIAGTVPLVGGDLARAHAVWAANVHRALYLTAEPHEVKSRGPGRERARDTRGRHLKG